MFSKFTWVIPLCALQVIASLVKLDASDPEQILLVSRDGRHIQHPASTNSFDGPAHCFALGTILASSYLEINRALNHVYASLYHASF
jgi:hypothetical protein